MAFKFQSEEEGWVAELHAFLESVGDAKVTAYQDILVQNEARLAIRGVRGAGRGGRGGTGWERSASRGMPPTTEPRLLAVARGSRASGSE